MNENAKNPLIVEVIEPQSWLKQTSYKLVNHLEIAGHTVPSGFVTDGATVPRFLSLVGAALCIAAGIFDLYLMLIIGLALMLIVVWFPPLGRYAAAAVLHDCLLKLHPEDRHYADREFRKAMIEQGIAKWRRKLIYTAVWIWSEIKMTF